MRSPNYPQLSLPDAIERIRSVYKAQHTAKADQHKVAEILGYGSLNGRSLGVLSAIKKYGLLQGPGEALSVSQGAVIIIERQPGHPYRVKELRKAALLPPLFEEIHNRFGGQVPADEDLRIFLASKGFSRTATNEITRTYRDTIELVTSEGGEYTDGEASDTTHGQELVPMQSGQNRPTSEPSRQTTPHSYRVERMPVAPLVVESESDQELRFKISSDSDARIIFRGEVTLEAIEKLIKLLELSKDTFPSVSEPKPATTQAIYDAVKEAATGALKHLGMEELKVNAILRSSSNSSVWNIDIEELENIAIEVTPGDGVEQIRSKITDRIIAL
jgi:hypothetical protein